MSNPIETLNNAIALLDLRSQGDATTPAGSRKAIHALALHWVAWFRTADRWSLDTNAVQTKLERYARWYGRAYAIASPLVQSQVPTPEQAAPQFADLLRAQREQWFEGMADSAKAGLSATQYVAKGAAELADRVSERAVGAIQGLGLAALALAAIWLSRGK